MALFDQTSPGEEPLEGVLPSWGSNYLRNECYPHQVSARVPVSDPRPKLKVLFFLTVASFVLGLLCFFPYLEEEHYRMAPSMCLLVWGSDCIGLVWFTWYFTKHYLLGEPFRYGMGESPRLTRGWRLALVSLTAALGFDLAVTSTLQQDERAGLARAVVVNGTIHSVQRTSGSEFHCYTIRCRFQDVHGAWHDGRFALKEHRSTHQFEDALTAEVQQALRNGQVPCAIPIAYDPVLPARNWIAGIDPGEGYRFHALSWCIRLFQAIAILNFVIFLRQAIKTHDRLPWWYDLHMVLPFMVGSAFLGFFGVLIQVVGFVVTLVFN